VGQYQRWFVYDLAASETPGLAPLVAEYDQSGNLVAKYHYDGGGLIGMTRGNQSYGHVFEGIGTARQLMGSQGQVVDAYAYDAWGNELTSPQSQVPNPFRHVGKHGYYLDTESALMLLGVRYYISMIARFLSCDPIRSNSIIIHRYSYARNNPVASIDPLGLLHYGPLYGSLIRPLLPPRCGKDISAMLIAALFNVTSVWQRWDFWQRLNHCLAIYTDFANAWDILELKNALTPQLGGSGICSSAGAPPSPFKAEFQTVSVRGFCYRAVAVNYILFGLIFDLCNEFVFQYTLFLGVLGSILQSFFSYPMMITLIYSWKLWKYGGRLADESALWATVGWLYRRYGLLLPIRGIMWHCHVNRSDIYLKPFTIIWLPGFP